MKKEELIALHNIIIRLLIKNNKEEINTIVNKIKKKLDFDISDEQIKAIIKENNSLNNMFLSIILNTFIEQPTKNQDKLIKEFSTGIWLENYKNIKDTIKDISDK